MNLPRTYEHLVLGDFLIKLIISEKCKLKEKLEENQAYILELKNFDYLNCIDKSEQSLTAWEIVEQIPVENQGNGDYIDLFSYDEDRLKRVMSAINSILLDITKEYLKIK